jgi:hypothetical protein
MYCGQYSAGVLHFVSDQIRNLQNCFTTPNKMTSEDDGIGVLKVPSSMPPGGGQGWQGNNRGGQNLEKQKKRFSDLGFLRYIFIV